MLPPSDARICTAIFSQLPIRKLIDSQAEQVIRRVIARSAILVSAPLPTDEALIVMVQFIRNNYSGLTAAEMILAFELNLAEELGPKIEHLQLFSTDYFAKVVNAYRSRKTQAVIAFNRKEASQKKALEEPKAMPEQLFNGLIKIFNDTGEAPAGWNYSLAFEWAWHQKMFRESPDQMKLWFEEQAKSIRLVAKGQMIRAKSEVERRAIEITTSDMAIKVECRKRWMIKYLNENHKG